MISNEQRFWSKVDKSGDCWLWLAGRDGRGYGKFSQRFAEGRRQVGAHRFAYELLVGPIPEGLQLDHLCRVRNCVNPAHLEPVTHAENQRRGIKGLLTTHCPQGHPYDEENTYHHSSGRKCRACNPATRQRYMERKKAHSDA